MLRLSHNHVESGGRGLEVVEKRRQAELIAECLQQWQEEDKGEPMADDDDSVDVEAHDEEEEHSDEESVRHPKRRRVDDNNGRRQTHLTVNYFLQFIGRAKANLILSKD
jgi:hypothetical protein